jgi:hypothetical protein
MKKLFVMLLVFVLAVNAFAYKDTYSSATTVVALYADTARADVEGVTVDLKNYTSCLFSVNVGASFAALSSSNYILVILQESATGSSWTDVTSQSSVFGTFAVQDSGALGKVVADSVMYRFGYNGNKRYVRLLLDYVGTHADVTIIGAEAILTKKFSGARP